MNANVIRNDEGRSPLKADLRRHDMVLLRADDGWRDVKEISGGYP
ncbi:MAG: hypothetical protein R3F54_00990 [Alphaproteobacteria bacterium]